VSVISLQSRFYLGEVGNGAAMKLVVNMMMGRLVLTKKSLKCLVAPKPLHIPDNRFELQFFEEAMGLYHSDVVGFLLSIIEIHPNFVLSPG
jgi:hypothetical protein